MKPWFATKPRLDSKLNEDRKTTLKVILIYKLILYRSNQKCLIYKWYIMITYPKNYFSYGSYICLL